MGNTTTSSVLPPAFQNLNEDTMVVLLQYLDVPDFVHLTQTSKKLLNETLGPNNYLWAQLLNRPHHPTQMSSPMHFFPSSPSSTTRLANQVLQTTRNGRKLLAVDGAPLDLTVPFDTVNKHLVSHFDFRKEIKWYYLMSKCTSSLLSRLFSLTQGTNAHVAPNIRVLSDINAVDYDTPANMKLDQAVDETFVVELGVNAASLEALKQQMLPAMHKSRRVVYAKSNDHAGWAYISRSRAMPIPQLQPQYFPAAVAAEFPFPVPQQPYPVPFMNAPMDPQPLILQPQYVPQQQQQLQQATK